MRVTATDRRGGRGARPLALLSAAALVLGACTGDDSTTTDAPAAQAEAGGATVGAAASGTVTDRGVTVTGTGTASATPDLVVAGLGAEVRADSVEAALTGANDATGALVTALRDTGVEDQDIRTTGASVREERPDRRPPPPDAPSPPEEPSPLGTPGDPVFVATNRVEVELQDLETAGATLQQALEAAGDAARLDRLELRVSNPSDALERAREAAFAAALDAAEQYASLADRSLGQLVAINEAGGAPPRPVPGPTEDAAAGVPLQPGQQDVQVSVTATWSLAD